MTEETHERTPEEFESMRKTVMQRKSVDKISDEDLPYFIAYMEQYKADLLDKEDYLGAKDAAAILTAAKAENNNRENKIVETSQNTNIPHTIEEKIEGVQLSIEMFDQETAKKQQSIQASHNKEMENFETKWREEMPDRYRRVSKRLVELRETAKTLAMAGHYDEAAARKKEADVLEAEEYKEAQNRLRRDYRTAKSKLIKSHEKELKKFNESRAEKRNLLVAQVHELELSEKNRENVLKSKPATTKRSAKRELRPAMKTRSFRKSQFLKENRLPPLRPPNEKEGSSTNDQSHSPKRVHEPEPVQEVHEPAPEQAQEVHEPAPAPQEPVQEVHEPAQENPAGMSLKSEIAADLKEAAQEQEQETTV